MILNCIFYKKEAVRIVVELKEEASFFLFVIFLFLYYELLNLVSILDHAANTRQKN